MRTTIRMNEGLRRQLMELAEKEGRTFTDLVDEAAARLLAERRNSGIEEAPALPVIHATLNLPDGMDPVEWLKQIQEEEDEDYIRRLKNGFA